MGISLERSTTYFVEKTRAILQECAKSPSKSRRRSQKLKPGKVNRSRSYTLLRVTHPTYQSMWVIILQLLLLRLVSHRLLGHSFHLRRRYNVPIHEVSSQKGAIKLISSEISEREMCLWAISKYFGDWVQTQVLKCENMPMDEQSANHKLRYVSKP